MNKTPNQATNRHAGVSRPKSSSGDNPKASGRPTVDIIFSGPPGIKSRTAESNASSSASASASVSASPSASSSSATGAAGASTKMKWKKRHTRGRNIQHSNTLAKAQAQAQAQAQAHAQVPPSSGDKVKGNNGGSISLNQQTASSSASTFSTKSDSTKRKGKSKTVFGPVPPPSTGGNSNNSNSSKNSKSSTGPGVTNMNMTNMSNVINMGMNMNMGGVNMNMNLGNVSVGMNMGNMSGMNMNCLSDIPQGFAEAFGDIDVLTMLQTEMMNQCVENYKHFGDEKNGNGGDKDDEGDSDGDGDGDGADTAPTLHAGGIKNNSSKSQSSQKNHLNVRDVLLNYAAKNTASTKPGKNRKKGGGNNSNANCHSNASGNGNNTSSGGDGTEGSTADVPAGHDAEMKALMNMFVEIMGMSLDPNGDTKKGGAGGNGSSKNIDNTMAAKAFVKENLARLKMSGFTAHHANFTQDGRKKKGGSGNGAQTSSDGNGNNGNNPFPPVFSMMFGGSPGNADKKSFKMPKVIPPPPGGWPPGAAAAAAAAVASANGASVSWDAPYEFNDNYDSDEYSDAWDDKNSRDQDDDDEDDCSIPELLPVSEPAGLGNQAAKSAKELGGNSQSTKNISDAPVEDPSTVAAAELLREEEEAASARNEDEEKAKRAAKKREKKQRKKERARREAAVKAAEASIKKREKTIISWRSRVVTAFTGGEVKKVESLITENPFKRGKQLQLDPEIIEFLDNKVPSHQDEINDNMEWLLNSCVVKNTCHGKGKNWLAARNRLCKFVADLSFHSVFECNRDSRSALHHACFSGDEFFIKIVVERHLEELKGEGNTKFGEVPNHCLELMCEHLGWTALHYAAVGGWSDIVEVLLGNGCDVNKATNASYTCRARNRKGLNARGLIETIATGTYSAAVESSGDSFRELVDVRRNSNVTTEKEYLDSINSLIIRLKNVEENGYTPLENTQQEVQPKESDKVEKDAENNKVAESSKNKKKKKKKKENLASKSPAPPKPAPPVQPQSRDEERDPLVSALLAMGFSNEQIDAAVLSFGGTDRVTADDMVMWILERESNSGIESGQSQTTSNNAAETQQQSFDVEEAQRRAEEQARKAAEEATNKALEARRAAERLAAKREEQRRIRREWNNREQIRQQEQAKAKLAEEVQRRKLIEAEKARALAQRVAEERAAPSVLSQAMGRTPLDPLVAGGISNVMSVPLFSNVSPNALNEGQNSVNAQNIDHSLSTKTGKPEATIEGAHVNTRRSSGSKSPKPNRKISGNGKSKKGKQSKGNVSPKRRNPVSVVQLQPTLETAAMPANMNGDSFSVPYDSNPLGEIRATAREFVPKFKPNPMLPGQTAKPLPQSTPPGLGLETPSQTEDLAAKPGVSMLPQHMSSGNTIDSSSSLLPGFERNGTSSNTFSASSIGMNMAPSTAQTILPQSSVPSGVTIPGLPITESSFMSGVLENNRNREDELVSSLYNPSVPLDSHASFSDPLGSFVPLDTNPLTSHRNVNGPLGSFRPLDSNIASTALSGGGIWGGGGASSSGNSGGSSNFAFAQNNVSSTFSSHEKATNGEDKESGSNTWGAHSSGGSIW